jgi:hypothetical protein
MISVIAVRPESTEQANVLERVMQHFEGAELHLITENTVTAVNAALSIAAGDTVMLIDARSLPLGTWRTSLPVGCDILGGVVHTYAGTRAGYGFERVGASQKTVRRQAVPVPENPAQSQDIEVPNEGCLLIRSGFFAKCGLLDPALSVEQAILEFTLRVIEQGGSVRYDAEMCIERCAGALEPTLAEELAFSALRSERQWSELLSGHSRRTELRRVSLIAHGSRDKQRLTRWLTTAGYPVSESVMDSGGDPRAMLEEALCYRDRCCVLIDLRAEPPKDWLLELIDASTLNRSVGIVTCNSSADAFRIVAADATATLIVTNRIPAQIRLDESGKSFDQAVAELCAKSAAFGIVSTAVAARIDRMNVWEPRHFDTHSFESLLGAEKTQPKVTLILLAASATGVHRFTTDAFRSHSNQVVEQFMVVRSDAPKIAARLRNQNNVELFVDPDDELAGTALSRALTKASGDIVAIMRDDYFVADHWLDDILAHLNRLPHAGIVVPLLSGVPGAQNCESEIFADSMEFRRAAERRRRSHAREARLVDFVHMPSFVMRRSVLEKVGDFDETMGTSNCGIIDYCIRARTAGFEIAVAEDVYVHHIPFEHSHSPFEEHMGDEVYSRRFAAKWRLSEAQFGQQRYENLINTSLAQRNRFVMPVTREASQHRSPIRNDEKRTVFLLPAKSEETWQSVGTIVRKYLGTFVANEPITLAIGRESGLKTGVIASRIRNMISEKSLSESLVPDIVIADAHDVEQWLGMLPDGPRFLLTADERLPGIMLLDDISPSGMRRAFEGVFA